MNKQKKNLMQRLKRLQALIDAETDTTFRDALNREKTECLEQIMELATQQTSPLQLQSSTQEQTIPTPPTTTETLTQPTQQPTTTEVITQNAPTIPTAIAEKYVTFHNDVNSVSLGRLSALEANLLFAIFNKLKDKEDELLVFEAEDIRAMIGSRTKVSLENLSKIVEKFWKNIRAANFWVLYERAKENIVLFRRFRINYHDTKKTQVKSIEIQVNTPHFGYLLNHLHGNFTSFELLEFQNISGKYTKTLYRLLKQWKSVGVPPKKDWREFRELMGVSLNVPAINVEHVVLRPAVQELQKLPHFENLCYEKIKTKGMGNRITHIQFYFEPITKTSKDREQVKRDIRTIAWEIRSKKAVKLIKQSMEQLKQSKQDKDMQEVVGMAFYKPQDPSVILVVDAFQPAQEGYEILVKYYKNGKEFQARSAVLADKETFLTAMAKGGYQIVNSQTPKMQQKPQQTPQPKEVKVELQTDQNGFKTFQGLVRPNQSDQPQALNPNNGLTEYIGRNIYMSNNGVPAVLKIKDIYFIENGYIRVDVQDIDKPHKILNPFILNNVKYFKSWFKKYME
ncbi:replication initiation protein [Helicobacter gastrocanis]|nr:replication initiation protein [Helicobacter sp. NHP19-003]